MYPSDTMPKVMDSLSDSINNINIAVDNQRQQQQPGNINEFLSGEFNHLQIATASKTKKKKKKNKSKTSETISYADLQIQFARENYLKQHPGETIVPESATVFDFESLSAAEKEAYKKKWKEIKNYNKNISNSIRDIGSFVIKK